MSSLTRELLRRLTGQREEKAHHRARHRRHPPDKKQDEGDPPFCPHFPFSPLLTHPPSLRHSNIWGIAHGQSVDPPNQDQEEATLKRAVIFVYDGVLDLIRTMYAEGLLCLVTQEKMGHT